MPSSTVGKYRALIFMMRRSASQSRVCRLQSVFFTRNSQPAWPCHKPFARPRRSGALRPW